MNCKIDLRNRVFIPRIETEFWVKIAIKELPETRSLAILDMFAGSGCIGIAILKNVKNSFVDFVDSDKKAIEQIKINLRLNHVPPNRYKIYKSNLFEKLKRKYDYIFANPPYVARERIKEVESSVLKYEPRKAILGGKKGLFYIKRFFRETKKFLKPDGVIYLEIDPLQKKEIEDILNKDYNPPTTLPLPRAPEYKNFKFFKDQFKKYRFLKVEKQ